LKPRAPLIVILLLVAVAADRPAGLGDVRDVRVFDHGSHTRVVVELSREAEYRVGTLENPPRLYLDIDGVWIDTPLTGEQPGGEAAPVRLVRGGQNTLRRARVVMELDQVGREHRTFHLTEPFRIVTDVYADGERRRAAPLPHVEAFDSRPVRRVVIDAGHGGKDPGAIGAGRVREKDVVLRVARELAQQLKRDAFEVHLTRADDRFLPLQARTDLANRLNADLFVSIHANASPRRTTAGVETYLLDTRYDRQTARVAARENGTSVEDLSELQKILASLRLGYNERFAARLAGSVHASLVKGLQRSYGNVPDLGVKRGPFLVLFQADMPAILVEVGFVSNRAESKRLLSRGFAQTAAQSIAQGIRRYRDEHARSLVAGR
jgi:N-acetylmuramoyl-L-alanine amidase